MTLYIVATPIGNLEDISIRAINVLSNVDFILAEDTRITKVLLDRYNIRKEVISYHQHSGLRKVDYIIGLLKKNHNLALVSDAGTPGVNDPGGFLVKKILESVPEAKIVPVPGPNAAITALSASGFPADTFRYLGFIPHKKGRQTFFKNLQGMPETLVFYESKHRIGKTLEALKGVLGERPVLVARELTKQFETLYRGTIEQVSSSILGDKLLGEFVVVIGPQSKKHDE